MQRGANLTCDGGHEFAIARAEWCFVGTSAQYDDAQRARIRVVASVGARDGCGEHASATGGEDWL